MRFILPVIFSAFILLILYFGLGVLRVENYVLPRARACALDIIGACAENPSDIVYAGFLENCRTYLSPENKAIWLILKQNLIYCSDLQRELEVRGYYQGVDWAYANCTYYGSGLRCEININATVIEKKFPLIGKLLQLSAK
jgi:hypothetical protein